MHLNNVNAVLLADEGRRLATVGDQGKDISSGAVGADPSKGLTIPFTNNKSNISDDDNNDDDEVT